MLLNLDHSTFAPKKITPKPTAEPITADASVFNCEAASVIAVITGLAAKDTTAVTARLDNILQSPFCNYNLSKNCKESLPKKPIRPTIQNFAYKSKTKEKSITFVISILKKPKCYIQ